MTEPVLPEVDARQTWKNDHEKLGSYKLYGKCRNCQGESAGVFTKGYKPSDGRYGSRAKCPHCGCDTMTWRGLAE